jgi:hypothetical protein
MPETGWFCKSEFFNDREPVLEVCNHFLYRDMIVSNSWCFSIPGHSELFNANNQCWLVGLCSTGYREGIFKTKVIRNVFNFQFNVLSAGRFNHLPELFIKRFCFDKIFQVNMDPVPPVIICNGGYIDSFIIWIFPTDIFIHT